VLPNELIVLRNEGKDQQGHGEELGGMEGQQGRSDQGGGHNLSRCCDTITWPLGRVSLLSPLWHIQGGSHAPNPYIINSRHHIRARVFA
jgi:hypothetical protein